MISRSRTSSSVARNFAICDSTKYIQSAGGYSVPNYGATPGPWSSQGGGYSYPSSRELKYGIEKINPEDSLDVVMNTPVRGYKYKGSTEPFIGTIAEDAPREISDGKRVNLVNQVGSLTGAVQAITQQLRGATNMAKPASSMAKPSARQQRRRGGRDKEHGSTMYGMTAA